MTRTRTPADPVLIVDDDEGILLSIDTTLQLAGIDHVVTCADSREALKLVEERRPGLILLDLNMPHLDGETILARVTEGYPDIPVIIITGRIDTDTAVDCMKSGAYDYIVKPVEENKLLATVRKALQYAELQRENITLNEELREDRLNNPEAFTSMVTKSAKMLRLFTYAESVAPTPHPVLICGETGTGKELMARALHRLSGVGGQFVAINVAGLDDNVFADTLFGHVKGAFTGADADRSGLLEQAAGGTLFLDEIGDLSASSQIKLLRLLQEREYMPLGLDCARRSSARIIASTHVDLWLLQERELFRQDLHYRLRTHRLLLPPLRQRREDIYPLLDHFCQSAAASLGRRRPKIPQELVVLLESYSFPGNIRELQAMVFDAVAQSDSAVLPLKTFRLHMLRERQDGARLQGEAKAAVSLQFADPLPTIKEATRMLIEEAMRRADNNQTTAAALLGISQQALSKRLRQWKEEE